MSLSVKRKKKGGSARVDIVEKSKEKEKVEKKVEKVEKKAETEEKKVETVEKKMETVKKKVETVMISSSEGEHDLYVLPDPSEVLDFSIGNEEEMYLASTREDLYEVVMNLETLGQKVREKDLEELFKLTDSLIRYGREHAAALLSYRREEEEEDKETPYERTKLGQFSRVLNFQQKRMELMHHEMWRRYVDEKRASRVKEMKVKILEEEVNTLRKSLDVLVTERSELLNRPAPRSVAVEKKDASVSTEAEGPVTEMAGDLERPSPVKVSRERRGALETLIEERVAETLSRFEEKVTETLSRFGVSMSGKTGGEKIPPGTEDGQAPQVLIPGRR